MSQYWGDDSERVMHVAVISVFAFLALIAVIFRLWARRIQQLKLGLNDCLCAIAVVFALALSLFTIHSNVYWALGADTTQPGNANAMLRLVILQVKALITGQILWVTAVFFLRASLISLYIHIFRTKSFRITCYIVHGFNFAFFAAVVLASLLICRPISTIWNPEAGTCGRQKLLDLFIGILNLLLDVCIVVLPMPLLWRLQMSLRKKLVLGGIFGMGIIICIVTLVRIWVTSLIREDESNSAEIYSMIALLTCLEALLGAINACLPVIRPIFTKIGNSRIWSAFISSISSSQRSLFSRSTTGNRSGTHSRAHRRSEHPNEADEMRKWPSPKQAPAPQFVDLKAAKMMFSHDSQSSSIALSAPRPPPKSPCYQPDGRVSEEASGEGITVQREWDVERGDSGDTDRRLLREEGKNFGGMVMEI